MKIVSIFAKTINLTMRRLFLFICTSLILLVGIFSIVVYYAFELNLTPVKDFLIILISIISFILLSYGIDFRLCFNLRGKNKEDCPFIDKEDCPFASKSECPYNTTFCIAFQGNKKRVIKSYLLMLLFIITLCTYVASVLGVFNDHTNVINNICLSLISAMLVAYLIDIPGKMKEYHEYFVDLLSSNEYLRHLDDDRLSKLRKKITWVLHAKDYPNMPRALIQLDERICNMLREPYFKEFSQIISLTKSGSNVLKLNTVEYTIQNPGADNRYISADIGLSNSIRFSDSALKDDKCLITELKQIIDIKSFHVYIDDDKIPFNLLPYIRILVVKGKRDTTDYNGEIHIAPLYDYSNKDNPLSATNMNRENSSTEKKYEIGEINKNIDLYLMFKKRIVVKLEYEISVPEDDICFSKRLRYPVKYFNLDYSLGNGFEDVKLSGQLIGTLIDQEDISYYLSENKRKLSFRTHNWLLPKNGVFIVHSK